MFRPCNFRHVFRSPKKMYFKVGTNYFLVQYFRSLSKIYHLQSFHTNFQDIPIVYTRTNFNKIVPYVHLSHRRMFLRAEIFLTCQKSILIPFLAIQYYQTPSKIYSEL